MVENYSVVPHYNPTEQINQAIGIRREMLTVNIEEDNSVERFIDAWKVHIAKVNEAIKPFIDKMVRNFAHDIIIAHTKTFKAKTIHHNGGSMRKRKTRHFFTRVNKQIVVKETLFKNAYPINFKEDANEKASGD